MTLQEAADHGYGLTLGFLDGQPRWHVQPLERFVPLEPGPGHPTPDEALASLETYLTRQEKERDKTPGPGQPTASSNDTNSKRYFKDLQGPSIGEDYDR